MAENIKPDKLPHPISSRYNFSNKQRDMFLSKREIENIDLHSHTFFELEIILGGSGSATFNGKKYALRRGMVYLSCPTDTHSFITDNGEKCSLLCIAFIENVVPTELLDVFISNRSNVAFLDEQTLNEVCNLFEIIYRNQISTDEFEDSVSGDCIRALLGIILRNIPKQYEVTKEPCILEALNYIRMNFRTNLKQDDVAKKVGLSTPYFSSLFRSEIGCGYKEYVTTMRVTYAKKLMTTFGKRPSEACYESGFNSYSSFLKSFCSVVGESPVKYISRTQDGKI